MKHYKQLTEEQRYQISGLKKAGLNQSQIADEGGYTNRRYLGNLDETKAIVAGVQGRRRNYGRSVESNASMYSVTHCWNGRKLND